jgi:flagellar biosynthesis protein FliR
LTSLIHQLGEQQAAAFMLVLARVSPLFLLAPLFSARQLPARARGVAAVALAVGMAPIVSRGQRLPLDPLGLGSLVGKEIMVGLAFAFAVGVVLTAVAVAGSFLDVLSGFSYGSLVDPLTGSQSALLSQAYALIGLMVFIAIGGDALVLQGLARTYELVPLRELPSLPTLTAGVQLAFVAIFRAALELAAPVILALLITDAAFGLMTRVVPALNVFAVGVGAKIAICLVLVVASLTFLGGWIGDEVEDSVSGALRSLEVTR